MVNWLSSPLLIGLECYKMRMSSHGGWVLCVWAGLSLTSGNLGCVLLMACEEALTAWASSCSRSPLVLAASQILRTGTQTERSKVSLDSDTSRKGRGRS